MATIDLIVLGMLKKGSMGAYDIQKLVEYRNISKWVKISTQSIYKKALQLEEKGFITAEIVKEGKMPEKAVYTLTEKGEREFERLMMDISAQPIRLFLDFNAVIVNLDSLPPEEQADCISQIEKNINELTENLKENYRQKEDVPEVPETGMAVLRQQLVLAQALEGWIAALKEHFSSL
ncbi:PadR family transcriptional regulator [Acutalibacter muris]|jgi:DNA-binding PadR family transcriptional regulator|uniref:PadR family transcriptional regulator n=1 Tax=Acutalibacter muris TaxID=1796620 RepID=UPI0026F3CA6B|nr:PadR family transcriptional regulator [Acutalibacter muris]